MSDRASQRESESASRRDDGLPEGWVEAPVSEIGELLRGVSYKKAVARETPAEGYLPILRATNIQSERLILDSDLVYVPREYVKPEQKIRHGDVVICMSSGSKHLVGKTAQFSREWEGSFGAFCAAVRLNPALDQRFAGYFFGSPSYRRLVRERSSGVNINNLRRGDIETLLFPVAPLAEQSRIADAIETQFTRLEAGVAALKRAQANLRRYKAAVLKAACEGRLVPTEMEVHRRGEVASPPEPAGALLARILAERRARWQAEHPGKRYKEPAPPDTSNLPDLPEGWCYTLLTPLLSVTRPGMRTGPFGSLLKKHEHRIEGVPVLGIENIESMKFVPGNKIFVTKAKATEISRYDVQSGDILISRSGTVGKVCVVPPGLGEARISTNLMRVVLAPNGMLPRFFMFLFNGSPFVLDQVSGLCSGSTRDFLNQKILSSIVFPLPPLAEQRRIVGEVERRLSVVQELEKQVEAALRRAERLRQAVLKHAFAGRLVPQDPTDEPASVLLERIRAARGKRRGKVPPPKSRQTRSPTL